MDESPLTKLTEHATAAHQAVQLARDSARQVAEQAAHTPPPEAYTQGQAGSGAQ